MFDKTKYWGWLHASQASCSINAFSCCVCWCCQPPGAANPSLSAVLYLPGSPGLDPAALRWAQRQATDWELRQCTAQRKWRETRYSELPCSTAVSWTSCVNSRCWRRTVCVSASVMEACCPCSLACLELKRYFTLAACLQTVSTNKIQSGSIDCTIFLVSVQVYGLENSRMSKQVVEQVNEKMRHISTTTKPQIFTDGLRDSQSVHFSLQLLETNSMKGGVELLEIRPEQLSSADLGDQLVLLNKTP